MIDAALAERLALLLAGGAGDMSAQPDWFGARVERAAERIVEVTGLRPAETLPSPEWLDRGGDAPLFAPLPEEADEAADVKLSEIEGMSPATVAVLEEGGYRTLNDIIDLERDDLLRLPGIAPEEADRIIAMIEELTEEGGEEGADDGAQESNDAPRRGGSAA